MNDIDVDGLDAKVDGERQWLVVSLRRIADRLEELSPRDAIEPLTMLSEQAEGLIRRAEGVLRVSLGSPPQARD